MSNTAPRTLTLVPTRSAEEAGQRFDGVEVFTIYSHYVRATVRLRFGYISPEGSARQEYQGPIVPGPWAFTFPLSTIIDNHGGTGREASANREAGVEFDAKLGDRFVIDGRTYELTEYHPHSDYPALTLIAE